MLLLIAVGLIAWLMARLARLEAATRELQEKAGITGKHKIKRFFGG